MKKNRRSSGGRRGVLVLTIAICLLAILATAAMLWKQQQYAFLDETPATAETESRIPTEPPSTAPTPGSEPTQAPDTLDGKHVLNILITGQDRREEDSWGRSDTMILCSVNAETNTATMVSFLRDLYVPIPGHGSSRLNAAYSWGGVELLNETLVQNFDAPIDGNIEIDFFDFMALIDYLGGVEVELTAAEAAYLNEKGNWGVEDNVDWNLTEGEHLLTGSQALAYSRIRYIDSDFVRTERQRRVLTLVLEKLHQLSRSELINALDMLLENSTMSFSEEELFRYALGFYPVLADGNVITARIPADGTWKYETISGMSIVQADLEANTVLLKEYLNDPQ